MDKIIVLIASVLLCGGAGWKISKKYGDRERYFKELVYMCDEFSREMNFTRATLGEFFRARTERYPPPLREQTREFVESLGGGAPPEVKKGFLRGDEAAEVAGFFSVLGTSDAESQDAAVQAYKRGFTRLYERAGEEKKKYGGLFFKLGILAGAAFGILAF